MGLKMIGKPGVCHVLHNSLEKMFAEINKIERKYKVVDTMTTPFWDGLSL